MFRLTVGRAFLVVAALVLVCGWSSANAMQKGKPHVPAGPKPLHAQTVGAKWDYKIVDEKGKLVVQGTFFAHNNKIVNPHSKQVGTYEDVSQTHVKIDADFGKLKGKTELHRDNPNVLTWKGELERGSGLKYKITIVFEKLK